MNNLLVNERVICQQFYLGNCINSKIFTFGQILNRSIFAVNNFNIAGIVVCALLPLFAYVDFIQLYSSSVGFFTFDFIAFLKKKKRVC